MGGGGLSVLLYKHFLLFTLCYPIVSELGSVQPKLSCEQLKNGYLKSEPQCMSDKAEPKDS